MAGADLGCMEMVYISDEIIGMVERYVGGVTVTPETLAFDVVKEIGPEGEYLSHDHTLAHFREELFLPKLFDREAEQTWIRKGERDLADVAREKVKEILGRHQVPALSDSQLAALAGIIAETEDEIAASSAVDRA
jgi:trimethylamine--corrinoid protein Co-methyltransferase